MCLSFFPNLSRSGVAYYSQSLKVVGSGAMGLVKMHKRLKGLADVDLTKKMFFFFFIKQILAWIIIGLCTIFYVRFFCSINFCFDPYEIRLWWSKNRWLGISPQVQLFTDCVLRQSLHFVVTHVFVDSACKQVRMACLRNLICSELVIRQAT